MNRRRFVMSSLALTAFGLFRSPQASLAVDPATPEVEVTPAVEPCPCECSNDEGKTWFCCDEAGNEVPCPGTPEEPVPYEGVTTLPQTGSGPQGWQHPRVEWMTDPETGEDYLVVDHIAYPVFPDVGRNPFR